MNFEYGLSCRHLFKLSLSFLSGMTSFFLKQSSKLSQSFVKNKQSHLISSLPSMDTELYFCVKNHKEWFLCRPLKASSNKASRFFLIYFTFSAMLKQGSGTRFENHHIFSLYRASLAVKFCRDVKNISTELPIMKNFQI